MSASFKGGIHLYEGKELSKETPVVEYVPQGDVVFPVAQHIGAPAKPVVAKGDKVLVGQVLAEAGGFVSANIHSSVSGTVKAVEPRLTSGGARVTCVVVENDNEYTEIERDNPKSFDSLSKEEFTAIVQKAGIVGMGGAGFPTHVKLSPKEPEKIDYIIVNAAECEPYITADYRRLIEEPTAVLEGLKMIVKFFPNATGVLAIEDNKQDCINLFEKLVSGESRIKVVSLLTKYPQGGERQLIKAVTGREINASMLPADAGCIVDNVDTIRAIYEAVSLNKPLTDRFVTVSGDAIAKPGNFRVKLGTNISELIRAAGGFSKQPMQIIAGGPMMGVDLISTDVPTTKTFSSLLCLSHDDAATSPETACINCARCVKACPERLIPSELGTLANKRDLENFEVYYGVECIECGSCSYVCPAKRPLAQSIRAMKKVALEARRKAKA